MYVNVQQEYEKARRAGQREYRSCLAAGQDGYVQVLDEIFPQAASAVQVRLGLLEIPIECIAGTKTASRKYALSPGFLPLLDPDTEFADKWRRLCSAHMSDEGIQSPIDCFEYYGRFYVQEGNKRVSVLRYFGSASISANVVRLMPTDADSPRYALYQEFLEFYRLTGLYQVEFTIPGSYRRLLAALDRQDRVWTEEERKRFRIDFARFRDYLNGQVFLGPLQPADALLVFLRYHPIRALRDMGPQELRTAVAALQSDLSALANPDPVAVCTAPPESAPRVRLFSSLLPKHLHIAFVHERDEASSTWTWAHEQGRLHLQELMDGQVETRAYFNAKPGVDAEQLLEQAVRDGADIIFTTTPQLIGAAVRASVRFPEVRFFNCSVNMPYPGVKTYYARVYEAKFVIGAIAGAMARDGRIGYVADSPILGVPASINAFCLGARLVNPEARVYLQWSCQGKEYLNTFRNLGISIVSNRDVPTSQQRFLEFGTFKLKPDSSLLPLGSVVWHWGTLYEHIVRTVLDGTSADTQLAAGSRAINYWWGMQNGVIDVLISEKLPEGVHTLAKLLRRELQAGSLDPFRRVFRTQNGRCSNPDAHTLSIDEILHMDDLLDCVEGHIPQFDELLPMAQKTVRLLGVYRDQLPPEPEDLL